LADPHRRHRHQAAQQRGTGEAPQDSDLLAVEAEAAHGNAGPSAYPQQRHLVSHSRQNLCHGEPNHCPRHTSGSNAMLPEAKRARNGLPRRVASRKAITGDRPALSYALLLLDRLHLRVFSGFGFSSSRGGM
jgi:hypothetical protein